jgi:hypothetical protein
MQSTSRTEFGIVIMIKFPDRFDDCMMKQHMCDICECRTPEPQVTTHGDKSRIDLARLVISGHDVRGMAGHGARCLQLSSGEGEWSYLHVCGGKAS